MIEKVSTREHLSRLVFDEPSHRYIFEGHPVPGVTRVIRESGMSPFGTGEPSMETRPMTVGKWVHKMCELHFLGKLEESSLSPAMTEILAAVKEWAKTVDLHVLDVERPLVHSLYRYGGKIDLLAVVRGVPAVIDWKWGVSRACDEVQVGGYVALARDCYIELKDSQVTGIPMYLKDLLAGKEPKPLRGKKIMDAEWLYLCANATYRWRLANGLIRFDGAGEDEEEVSS